MKSSVKKLAIFCKSCYSDERNEKQYFVTLTLKMGLGQETGGRGWIPSTPANPLDLID